MRRVRSWHRTAAALLAAGIALGALPHSASAQSIPWRQAQFDLRVNNESLSVFLSRILTLNGLASSISAPIASAKVNGILHGSADTIFRELASTYGLTWYYDGTKLYIYSLSEIESRLLQLQPADVTRVERTLKDMGLWDSRFPLKVSQSEGQVLVSGPPRYVQIVSGTLEHIANTPSQVAKQIETRVFRLRYARAADTTVNVAGRETSIPGVATILNETLGANSSRPPTGVAATSRSLPVTVPGLRGKGQIAVGRDGGSDADDARSRSGLPSTYSALAGSSDAANESSSPAESDSLRPNAGAPKSRISKEQVNESSFTGPVARADPRINAVIIRDTQERMPMYTRLINELDVGTPLLEIEATVIDVSYDKSEQLGIDWRLHGSRADIVSSPNGLAGNGQTTPANAANDLLYAAPPISAGTGLIGTLLFGSARTHFLARLNALTEKGDANLISKPRVLTLDNTEAVLQSTRDFYVRVAGREQVDLFNVTSGLVFRVTPTLIEDAQGARIKLNIRIEDGNADGGSQVDQIPVVNRNAISTQAVVGNGASLLIGGYTIEAKTRTSSGVPVLSEVPGLRWLFGQQGNSTKRMERIFMITPRLVKPEEAGGGTGAARVDPPNAAVAATTPAVGSNEAQ